MKNLHFKTNVLLKSIIGKDLINDDNIAVLELVKNSYDANSPQALIVIKNIKHNDDANLNNNSKTKDHIFTENTSRIIIQDYGVGMSESDITDKWLNIAYSEKKAQKSKYNRILAGNKGVGRFSCDRLGEYLNLYSRKKNGKIVHLFVDWKKFEVEDKKDLLIQNVDVVFDEINPNEFYKKTGFELFENGTILEIIKLRSNWTFKEKEKWSTAKLLDLKKQLEKLINPNQAYTDNKFQITLKAEEFVDDENVPDSKKINGNVKNRIFEELNFRTTSIISQIGSNGEKITTTLQDKGRTIFKLIEKNVKFTNLKNVGITLYFLNSYSKAYFTKQTGIRSLDFGSIHLFINGFRIPPYGDEGDDWLKIEIRKGQGYNRFFSTRDLVGRIEILDEVGNFKIISSRTGIENNESYHQLVDRDGYFYKTFRRLERYVVEGIEWDSLPEYLKTKIGEIESKVIDGKWSEEDEIFVETDSDKFRRIYSLIHSIIGARQDEVISLYVNEELILQKVAEEKQIAEKEFEKLLDDFSQKKINVEAMNRVLIKKAELDKELLKQINDFSKYSVDEATTKALLELELLRETIKSQNNKIKSLIEEIQKLEKQNAKTQNQAIQENRKKDEIILFHQKLLSKDVKQLVEFHHIIGISADTIDKHLINLKNDLLKGKTPSRKDLFELIEDISFESKKIISITNFATVANFKAEADEIESDLKTFIKQYAERVSSGILRTYDGSKNIKISVDDKDNNDFIIKFKPIEIAIILDNLFSNSRKAKATAIVISFNRKSSEKIEIHIKDNGKGIEHKDKDEIFNFGVTTTSGSGLGLHHVKNLMKNYDGEVTVNKQQKIGAEFILTFHI